MNPEVKEYFDLIKNYLAGKYGFVDTSYDVTDAGFQLNLQLTPEQAERFEQSRERLKAGRVVRRRPASGTRGAGVQGRVPVSGRCADSVRRAPGPLRAGPANLRRGTVRKAFWRNHKNSFLVETIREARNIRQGLTRENLKSTIIPCKRIRRRLYAQ